MWSSIDKMKYPLVLASMLSTDNEIFILIYSAYIHIWPVCFNFSNGYLRIFYVWKKELNGMFWHVVHLRDWVDMHGFELDVSYFFGWLWTDGIEYWWFFLWVRFFWNGNKMQYIFFGLRHNNPKIIFLRQTFGNFP